ncbi:MAG TPA: AfsR/SARP family transcriptional regulator [Ilumatobacter sp.]|nr:AfsR/SARP family transcriptional regulator [Ilumatobacter sp.]
MARLAVDVLGRPTVSVDDLPIPLSPRQLALVVRLALARHRATPASRLLAAWPDPHQASDGALRVALTRLRPMLAPAQLTRVDGGYLLHPSPAIDADRFEQLVRAARDSDGAPEARVAQLDAALALWRGPAFDGLTDLDWAHHEATRLDELHEQTRDFRHELVLGLPGALGDDLIAQLTVDLARTPGREHRAGLLATAFYRAGRQGDALGVLADVREYLRDQLGLTPGRSLDELELRILNHDPRLALGTATALTTHPAVDRQMAAARALLREGASLAAEPVADAALGAARSHGHRDQIVTCLLLVAEIAVATGTRPIEPLIDEAHALARVSASGELMAQAALAKFGHGVAVEWQPALVDLTEPLALLPPAATVRIELLAAAAALLAFNGETAATEQLLHAAEDTHRAIGSSYSEAVWLATRAILGDPQRSDEAIGDAARAVELALAAGDSRLVVVAIHAVLKVGWTCAALDAVDGTLDALDEHSRRAGIVFGRVRVQIATGALALARGDLGRAAAAVEATRQIGEQLGGHAAGPAARWQDLQLALERGEGVQLVPLLRTLPVGGATGISVLALAAEFGDATDLERLREHVDDVKPSDTFTLQVALTARAAAARGDAELGEWAVPVLERLGRHVVLHGFGSIVLGPAPLFLGYAHAARGDWSAALAAFTGAEEIADDAGAALWLAEARICQARAHAELGAAEQAVRVLIGTTVESGWGRVRALAADVEAVLTHREPARR